MKIYYLFIGILLFTNLLYAQKEVSGYVVDAQTHKPIKNVRIFTQQDVKTTTNVEGFFTLKVIPETKNIICTYANYKIQKIPLDSTKKEVEQLQIKLMPFSETLQEIAIIGVTDIIKKRQVPMAVNTIKSYEIAHQIGTKELPELLNYTPSVYTRKSGGYGDVNIKVRGFDQRNTAVLINGMPVNDMESGNVYWSNWLGLADVTSTIQIQRGLGASKLAIPSVGGTINILTRPSSKKQGIIAKFDTQNDNYNRISVQYNSGILNDKTSISILMSHFKGNGYVDATQGEGYSFYLDTEYQINDKNRLQFTMLTAPQWHRQRNNAIRIADYIKYSKNKEPNLRYNSEWGFKNNKVYTWSKNYYHKPVMSLNWNYKHSDKTQLNTVVYASWGKGGGTGPIGNINGIYALQPTLRNADGLYRFDEIVAWNSGSNVPDFGAIRTPEANGNYTNTIGKGLTRFAFINSQAWYGSIVNLQIQIHKNWNWQVGVDLRSHSGKNALTVNDVLGADNYFDFFDRNNPNRTITTSDYVAANFDWNPFKSIASLEKIVFYNQGNVRWLGAFTQLEYTHKKIAAFVQSSISKQGFQRIDYFNLPRDVDGDGKIEEQKSDWYIKNGGNIKAGINYKMRSKDNVYLNAGYYSKQPLFEAVFSNFSDNTITKDLQNERISVFELGYTHLFSKGKITANLYKTIWSDRYVKTTGVVNGVNASGRMFGVKEDHSGIEVDAKYHFNKLKIAGMLSFGDWKYAGNIKGVKLYDDTQQFLEERDYNLDNLKVGNAAQFTAFYGLDYTVITDLHLTFRHAFYNNLYANIDINDFGTNTQNKVLKLPAYQLLDVGTSYNLEVRNFGNLSFQFTINNLLDTSYISESNTNIQARTGDQTWKGISTENQVFFGLGRTWLFGVKFEF